MLHQVQVEPVPIDTYRVVAGDAICDRLIALADRLRGARVLQVNATLTAVEFRSYCAHRSPLCETWGWMFPGRSSPEIAPFSK